MADRPRFAPRWDALLVLVALAVAASGWALPRLSATLAHDDVVRVACEDPDRLVLIGMGDTNLGEAAEQTLVEQGGGYAFEHLREHLAGDALIANLETPVAVQETRPPYFEGGKHRMPPTFLDALSAEGFTLVSLANNHAMDQGPGGLAETRLHLHQAGIACVGAGEDREEARRPVILDAGHTRVAVLGAFASSAAYRKRQIYAGEEQPGVYELDVGLIAEDVRAARRRADVVVLLLHWGVNYRDSTPEQDRYARQLVAAGVDLILGAGAHRTQKVSVIDGVPVVYSLGNGVFGSRGNYGQASPHNRCSLIARTTFEDGALASLELRPIVTDNALVEYQPVPASPERAREEWEPYLQRGGVTWQREEGGWYRIELH